MTDSTRRSLTQGEQFVLAQIQDIYGPQNEESDGFFSDLNEAAIFVKDHTGASVGVVVLTKVAQRYEVGTITSLDGLRGEWLRGGA